MDKSQPDYFDSHPLLQQPILYIAGLPPNYAEAEIAPIFEFCIPYKPRLAKDGSGTGAHISTCIHLTFSSLTGVIEFKTLLTAEKALVTLSARPLPSLPPQSVIVLSPFPPNAFPSPNALPTPTAVARLVKHLPPDLGDADLFELFRPFGPLVSVRRHTAFGRDTGLVEFWSEEHAQRAEQAVHCADVGGYTVAVQPYNPRRAAGSGRPDVNAPPFVPRSVSGPMGVPMGGFPPAPSMGSLPSLSSGPQTPTSPYSSALYTSPRAPLGSFDPQSPVGVQSQVFVHGPGQQIQLAPLSGPGSTSSSGLIDPCNLFIKNLDFDVDSHMLFEAFKQFGRIVSARVMRNDQGTSKGFGFVSFQTPDEASTALQIMDGSMLNNKQIVVRLHEPKALRQEKLRERFSGKRGARASGGASPVHSDGTGGEEGIQAEAPAPRPRRGSGSYFAAALQGNIVLHQDELSSLSPVVRREVLHGELSRRLKELDNPVPDEEAPSVIEALIGMPLDVIVEGLRSKEGLEALTARVRGEAAQAAQAEEEYLEEGMTPHAPSHGIERERAPSHLELPEQMLPQRPGPSPTQGVPLGLSASAPEHPSSPVSLPAQATTKPLTPAPQGGSSAGQTPTTEREKLHFKVTELGSVPEAEVDEVVDLLMTLTKKERALCAFNTEYLRGKVSGAREVVLAANGEETDSLADAGPVAATPPEEGNGKALPTTPQPVVAPTPTRPIVSSLTPSPAAQPSYTLETLAALPAAEIMRVIRTPNSSGLPLPKVDADVIRSTDSWMDSLEGKADWDRKQKLGEKLHKLLKGFGMRSAAKIAIALMDQEDLRSLAHLVNEYPMVLREKAQKVPVK
ncbi:hypothetical protein DACRYDRAFT_115923 [Dacryopinax primogenitus]|uniref:RRM domain-containing protein n=1 Tax=Dacryopinax primogenitus (strain DJM 731) TaxID=1858805 RepID=M5G1R7_DACPD|nr:uncharacterized protein DACRYDRAFT_115923 [Dacryopinax primogenitus]EJU02160.1 hypothetical protein DACRYDRAFT_115923 [Dacryopinax primogenitus]